MGPTREGDPGGTHRVLVTTVPFGAADDRPLSLLQQHSVDYVVNPLGRRLSEGELAEMVGPFSVLIAGTEPITARVMQHAPRLRLICRVGVGLDSVDLAAAGERGIEVCWTPDAPSAAVAELTIGLMIDLLRHVGRANLRMHSRRWDRIMGRRLNGSTVGVIGVGRIGRRVIAHLSGGFPEAKILANDLIVDDEFGSKHGVEWVPKDRIYRTADAITLHLPLTPATEGLIGEQEISLMSESAVLVNTSRGGMIQEDALQDALSADKIGGAAIDVFSEEPYAGPLAALDNCILTSHMGSMSEDCRVQMELQATEDAVRFLLGDPLLRRVPDEERQGQLVAGLERESGELRQGPS